jgi:hypothetical protein
MIRITNITMKTTGMTVLSVSLSSISPLGEAESPQIIREDSVKSPNGENIIAIINRTAINPFGLYPTLYEPL